jgi:hypothetical protein
LYKFSLVKYAKKATIIQSPFFCKNINHIPDMWSQYAEVV